jgi:putative oxidoreductase
MMRSLENTDPRWGVAVVRIVMGIILIVAGFTKFRGGIDVFTGFLTQAGIPLPQLFGVLIPTLELVGGILVLLGFGARWVALLYVCEFLTTTFIVKLPRQGWDNSRIDMMMLAAALMLVLAGPGKASLDEILAKRRAGAVDAARVRA